MEEQEDRLRAEFYFAQIPVWILFHKELQHSDVRVWAVLQRYAGDRWVCWPGYAAIAERACVSKRQVQSCIQRLQKVGALKVEHRKKRVEKDGEVVVQNNTNIYTLKIAPPSMYPASPLVVVADEGAGDDHRGFEGDPDEASGGLGGIATVATGMEIVATGGIAKISSEREPFINSNSKYLSVGDGEPDSAGAVSAQSADAESKPVEKSRGKSQELAPLRDDVELLCNTLVDYLLANGVRKTKVKITQKWRDEARLLLDRDQVDLQEALRVLRWSQNDSFWKSYILSMPKFRQKFDQLRIRSNSASSRHADAHAEANRLRQMAAEAERIDGQRLQIGDGYDDAF